MHTFINIWCNESTPNHHTTMVSETTFLEWHTRQIVSSQDLDLCVHQQKWCQLCLIIFIYLSFFLLYFPHLCDKQKTVMSPMWSYVHYSGVGYHWCPITILTSHYVSKHHGSRRRFHKALGYLSRWSVPGHTGRREGDRDDYKNCFLFVRGCRVTCGCTGKGRGEGGGVRRMGTVKSKIIEGSPSPTMTPPPIHTHFQVLPVAHFKQASSQATGHR